MAYRMHQIEGPGNPPILYVLICIDYYDIYNDVYNDYTDVMTDIFDYIGKIFYP